MTSSSGTFDLEVSPSVNDTPAAKPKRQSIVDIKPLHPGARYALFVLTFINLFNYIDRYVPSATKTMFQDDLHLTETETSLPLTAFILVYLATSPIFGYFSDHGWSRKKLIAFGVCLWSIATASAALSNNFGTLMFTRAMVGVGEAAYATIAPALLSDYYPAKERNRILSFFYIAIPVGAALGYGLGGGIGGAFGWRVAFCAVGLPGILLSTLCLFINEAPRGAQDTAEDENAPPPATLKEALIELPKNKHYVIVVLGMTAVTFGAGGMADWFPTYLERNAYYPDGSGVGATGAALAVGGVTVIGGIVGTSLGAFLGEWMKKRGYRQAYLSLSGVGMVVTTVTVALGLILPQNLYLLVFLLLVAQICLWLYIGPLNALIANCVPARVRTRSFALSIFVTHALGDAISPAIIGGISDATNNLRKASTIVPISFGIGAIIWIYGWLTLPELPVENVVFAPANTEEPKVADGNPMITVHRLSQIMGNNHPHQSQRHSAEMVVVAGGLGGSVVVPNPELLQADADAEEEATPSDTRLL